MSAQALSQLGVGLLGVWAFVQGLLVFPTLSSLAATMSGDRGPSAAIFSIILPFVLLLGLSYLLVFHSAAVARRVFPSFETGPAGRALDLQPILVGLAGVFIVVAALPGLVRVVPGFRLATSYGTPDWRQTRLLVAHGAQVVVGLYLLLRPTALLRLWQIPEGATPPSRDA